MPMYDYVCKDCGEKFEKIVTNNTVKVQCEKCKGENTERKNVYSTEFVLAGEGWMRKSQSLIERS